VKKSYAEFIADFPDDHEEDERDIVLFGGKLAAEAIAEMLRGLGYKVEPPEYMDEHGWDIMCTSTARGSGWNSHV
jgi:hypothetical protein